MNINIERIAAALKQKEFQIKRKNNNVVLNNTTDLFFAKRELLNNVMYDQDDITIMPEYLYIKALITGEIPEYMTNFTEITIELVKENSDFINYLIASNPNVDELIVKMLLSKKIPDTILIELAKSTNDIKVLEHLYYTDNTKLQLAILNNPMFVYSDKSELYYKHAFYNFSNYEFFSLKEEIIPEKLKEEYKRACEYRGINREDTHEEKTIYKPYHEKRDEPFILAYHQFAPDRLKYLNLVNSSKGLK